MAARILDPFTGQDITARVHALTERLRDANRRQHAAVAPDCTTWERYSIPARDVGFGRGDRMPGEGCERHGIFLSTND